MLYLAQPGDSARIESITAHMSGLRCLIAEDEEILLPSVALQTRIAANTREGVLLCPPSAYEKP